ncbi:MAG: hypothetical protein K8F26_01225 [Thiobacillus sp.]|nr:hypothetical protein [Thiobacillus sp.]
MLVRAIFKRLRAVLGCDVELHERNILLQAKLLSDQRREGRIAHLRDAEFRVFSQWGEDGIIDWLITRIPDINKSFVEFGVQNYRESNTRYLLMAQNWRGLVMDGSMAHIEDIRSQDIYWRHDILAKCAFIDRNNINELIAGAGFKHELGLLSIDIDGNDYWVWQAIEVVSPAIVVCEYNAVLGDRLPLTIPYEADFYRTRAHHSNLYFGASIRALIQLGESKGYVFVGTTSTGCNAFFVRRDLASNITSELDKIVAYPSSVREARDASGRLTYIGGEERQKLIGHLPFVDPESGKCLDLESWGELSSDDWRQGMGVGL